MIIYQYCHKQVAYWIKIIGKMKRAILFLIGLILLIISPVTGQVRLGIQGGLNVATASFSKEVLDADNITGYQIGPVFEAIAPFGLGFDIALLYSQKGFERHREGVVNDYLEMPLNLKWKFVHVPIAKPYLAVGPYAGFRIGGDKIWNVVSKDIPERIESRNFAAGINIGAGVELLSHLRVGITYSWGLTENYAVYKGDIQDIIDGKGKNRTCSITAAILF